MATRDQGSGETVLPSSRQPMQGSADYTSEPEPNSGPDKRRNRSAAEIEADLDAMTERLSANVDALVDRLSPSRLVGRSAGRVTRLVVTADGRPRPEIVGALVGGLLGVAVLAWWSRSHR